MREMAQWEATRGSALHSIPATAGYLGIPPSRYPVPSPMDTELPWSRELIWGKPSTSETHGLRNPGCSAGKCQSPSLFSGDFKVLLAFTLCSLKALLARVFPPFRAGDSELHSLEMLMGF